MSPRAQGLSPTAGRGIAGWTSLDTPTNRAASGLPGPVEKIPANSCPPSTESPHWPNGGCWAPSRRHQRRPPARLPRRVRVPFQPPPFPQSRPVVLPVSYTHLRAHETVLDLVCRLLLEKKKK